MHKAPLTAQPSGVLPHERVQQAFEAQGSRTPDRWAVAMEGEGSLTYRELDRRANRHAHHLRGLGVGPEIIVGICLSRSLGSIVSLLAVLKAGGAYLPLDPAYPAERLAYMLENARAALLITEPDVWPAGETPGCRQIFYRQQAATTTEDDGLPRDDRARPGLDPAVYAIYTSGSTGKPKGVAMCHGALGNLLRWQARACPLSPGSAVLQFAPLSFDVSFQEIFSTLGEGGTLVLVPEEKRRDPRSLLRLLDDQNVARVFLPPVMLAQLAEQFVAGGVLPRKLREIITAGEALRITPSIVAFISALRAANGTCELHNHYGPSETHVATAYTLPGEPETWPALPSIGRPIDGVQIRLLDADGQPAAPEQPGALELGGECLARGYLHDPALTNARFTESEGACWYRTGDVAQFQPDGNLQFLGRADDQVKIRGFRVEPGEIEAVLARHPAIRETAVGVRTDTVSGSRELVACFVPRDPEIIPAAGDLRCWLLDQVPDYLVPAHFVAIDRLPLTPSGKLDRRALPLQRVARVEPGHVQADPPQTQIEKLILRVWEETLAISRPGVRDNFFEVGGDSLRAMQVHARLCRELKCEFPITALFQYPTIAALAAHLGVDDRATGAATSIQDRARRQQQQQQQAAATARPRLAGTAARRTG